MIETFTMDAKHDVCRGDLVVCLVDDLALAPGGEAVLEVKSGQRGGEAVVYNTRKFSPALLEVTSPEVQGEVTRFGLINKKKYAVLLPGKVGVARLRFTR